ncbi:GNAT family N-acetyltransferase [Clostridium sp.]|uniref:GNAT family N-acetyltransferase n=1 Tax=Clostridium sp. TaxID=1506 RepID=UPI0032172F74
MIIRTGSSNELKSLWKNDTPTKAYFIDGIEKGNIEFWTIENEADNSLIGELYIFWDSEEKDEANGKDRAYLSAFRVEKDFKGLGYGKKLMKRVLQRIAEKGFKEVTIAADNDDVERLTAMYKSWGFNELIKLQSYDYHYIDNNNNPTHYEIPFGLYLNKLYEKR